MFLVVRPTTIRCQWDEWALSCTTNTLKVSKYRVYCDQLLFFILSCCQAIFSFMCAQTHTPKYSWWKTYFCINHFFALLSFPSISAFLFSPYLYQSNFNSVWEYRSIYHIDYGIYVYIYSNSMYVYMYRNHHPYDRWVFRNIFPYECLMNIKIIIWL